MNSEREKVQFFQSESSFGSQSNLSESRYNDFNNDIFSETDNIFASLRRQLQPIQSHNNDDKLQYVMRRARILHSNTIPEQIIYLKKIGAPENSKSNVKNCLQKLEKLLRDDQKVNNFQMAYKQFYNNYGKEYGLKDMAFSKKMPIQIGVQQSGGIKPQYIEIAYNNDKQKLRNSTPRVLMASNINIKDKESLNLKQEIYQLKKSLEENRKKHELQLINERLFFEKRLKIYLQNQPNRDSNLKDEVNEKSDKLAKVLNDNKQLQLNIDEQNKTVDSLKNEIASLKEQIELLRKTDNSILQNQQIHNKSYSSEVNEAPDKKNEKKIKNLLQQNELLKNQLKNERQRFYRVQSDLSQEEKRELQRNRKGLQKKEKQLEQLYIKFDQQRIQISQLTQNNISHSKISESLKRENEMIKSKIEKTSSYQMPNPIINNSLQTEKLQASRKGINKLQILDYEGDGIQGFAYYDNLSKQFKTRFKRSCLKDKELLYKANGTEIGVISNYQQPNKISIVVYVTNYSQFTYKNVKTKIINANENKIQGEEFEQKNLPSNEQIKVPVALIINQYPIGPLILLLQYQADGKRQQIRILLPAHIFKTMLAEQRSQDMINPSKVRVIPERKICKDLGDLCSYLKLGKGDKSIKASLFNEHTHTLIYLDAMQGRDGIELSYQHKEGNRKITEYFIKTLAFLLSK